jgi:hypothetical protein
LFVVCREGKESIGKVKLAIITDRQIVKQPFCASASHCSRIDPATALVGVVIAINMIQTGTVLALRRVSVTTVNREHQMGREQASGLGCFRHMRAATGVDSLSKALEVAKQ